MTPTLRKPRRKFICIQDENELAEWYKETQGPLTQSVVIGKLRERYPDLFIPSSEVDTIKVRKQASNWLYGFIKRNQLESKSSVASKVTGGGDAAQLSNVFTLIDFSQSR